MPSLRISSLPLKTNISPTDFLNIVDTQYGSGNYVSKKTTVGDLLSLAQSYFVAKIDFNTVVATINGQSGNVLLGISSLVDTTVNNPADLDLLAYDGMQQRWINKSLENEVLDCGTF